MPTIFAIDRSGSTGGMALYHETTRRIIDDELQKDPDMKILLWDHVLEFGTKEELLAINEKQQGRGGTEPVVVADHIKKSGFHDRLVLITDGQVGEHDVDSCTSTLGMDWPFTSTEVHLVQTCEHVNLSVPCPFTRNTPHQVHKYVNGVRETVVSVTAEEIQLLSSLDTIKTVDEYEAVREALDKVIVARTMGSTGDPTLRDRIIAMQKRIVNTQSTAAAKDSSVKQMIAAVRTNSPNALELAKRVTDEYYSKNPTTDAEPKWSEGITRLIRMCEGALKGSFDLSGITAAIKGDRARRAQVIAPIEIKDLADKASPDDILLLLADGEPAVLDGVDHKIVNKVVNCPLEIFNYPDLVKRLRGKIDSPVNILSFIKNPLTVSPLTKRAVSGGIALGCNREQIQYSTSSIAKAVSGGKLLGSPDLWFAVIGRIIESSQRKHLLPLLNPFMAQMQWRCERSVTFMSLQGLPVLPTFKVPLGVALWYVLAASAFSPDGKLEPARAHLSHIDSIVALQALTGYKLPDGVHEHITRLKVLNELLVTEKALRPTPPEAFEVRIRKRERTQLEKQKVDSKGRQMAALQQRRATMAAWQRLPPWARRVQQLGPQKFSAAQRKEWRKANKKPISPRIPFISNALFQNSVPIDVSKISKAVREKEIIPPFIPIDGPASAESAAMAVKALPPSCQALPQQELAALAAMVDTQLAFENATVPFGFAPFAAEKMRSAVPVTEWKYKPSKTSKTIEICSYTCRPYYTTNWFGTKWSDAARRFLGFSASEMWSVDKHYGDFVCKFGKYPTVDELLVYSYNRVTLSKHAKKTLPVAAALMAAEGIRRYARVTAHISPSTFKDRYKASIDIHERRRSEALSPMPRKSLWAVLTRGGH